MGAASALCLLAIMYHGHPALGDVQVNTQFVSSSPEADAVVSDTRLLGSMLEQGMGGVYTAAGLPANLGASASVDGQILGAAPPPPPMTTARSPSPPAPPPPQTQSPSAASDGGSGSPILVASLVVGAVGLLGVAAWAVMARGGNNKGAPAANVIPARIKPPPAYSPPSYEPEPEPYDNPNPAPAPPPAPVYYAPQNTPAPVYYAPQTPPAPVYYAPAPPPCPPPRQKVFRIVVRN